MAIEDLTFLDDMRRLELVVDASISILSLAVISSQVVRKF